MIVLNKKRLLLVASSVFMSILIFMFSVQNINDKNDYIATVSLPVSGKVVVVDARTRSSR